ncbi:MAG: hypothetical protein F9K49_02560 [Caedimonadaceae bacterium]|nr:MAG: hypothetical protein F9K49_02560 [Caedimonadaceae bacterium]
MLIKLTKPEKVELLNALKTGVIDTRKIPALDKVLNEHRPDLAIKELSDEELEARILELEKKVKR